MVLVKGHFITHYESIMIEAETEEQASVIYQRMFERGQLNDSSQDLELEIMQIGEENENDKESKWVKKD